MEALTFEVSKIRLEQQNKKEEDTILTVGKHKGRTYKDLVKNEPEYCLFILDKPNNKG